MDTTADGSWIDAHSHIWTRDLDRFPLAPGKTLADLRPPSFDDAELLAVAQADGVGRVVLIQHHPFHAFDNSFLIDTARRRPDMFRVVGMLDHTLPGVEGEMRRLAALRVAGFRIAPGPEDERWLDAPGMRTMWACAAQTGQAMCCLLDPRHLPSVARMCEQHPATTVVIDHLARIGADGTVRDQDVGALCGLARYPKVTVKVSAFYALGAKQPPYLDLIPMIQQVCSAFGVERLMWASDAPYQLSPPHSYDASIALVRDRLEFLSAEEREWLLRKTAERVFFG